MVFSTFLLSKDNDLAIENENINNYKAEHSWNMNLEQYADTC